VSHLRRRTHRRSSSQEQLLALVFVGWLGVVGVVGGVVVGGCGGLSRVGLRWSGLFGGRGSSFRIVVGKVQGSCCLWGRWGLEVPEVVKR